MLASLDLVKIKDKYGEKMMHFCLEEFATILEIDGKLFELLSENFAYSKNLYDDICNNSLKEVFVNFIYSLLEPPAELPIVPESAKELLDSVGYVLYECHTPEEINAFAKYYQPGEKICTFRKNRLEKCYVFFAVKKDVDEIRREDYFSPQRQDRYGTSVISIQFTRGDINILSIKNRYNHKVKNPDATYSNNLENIVPGLTRSFERDYGLKISQNGQYDIEIPGYIRANDGKLYKYNYEINGVYYCPDNIVIDDNDIISDYQEKEKYIVIDYFVVDLVNKKITLYDDSINDSFVDGFKNIRKIDVKRINGGRRLTIVYSDGTSSIIEIDKCNRIISYKNNNILDIGDNFLYYGLYLKEIDISNVRHIGNGFMYSNNLINNIDIPNVLDIKDDFMTLNTCLNKINSMRVISIGNNFLTHNMGLSKLDMCFLEKVGNGFLSKNKDLIEVNMPSLLLVGDRFLQYNMNLLRASFPKLMCVGNWFISANKNIMEVDFSSLEEVGDNFLASVDLLSELVLMSLKRVGNNFLFRNRSLVRLVAPLLQKVGNKFLYYNNSLFELDADNLISIGDYFLQSLNIRNKKRVLSLPGTI